MVSGSIHSLWAKALSAILLVALVLVVALILANTFSDPAEKILRKLQSHDEEGLTPELPTAEMAKLCELSGYDLAAWQRWQDLRGSLFRPFVPRPRYVRERIIQLGKYRVLDPLLKVVRDKNQSMLARSMALRMCAVFRGPKVLDASIEFVEAVPEARGTFVVILPIGLDSPYLTPVTGVALLKKDLETMGYEGLVLHLLDVRMKEEGCQPFDRQIRAFLNRYYGYDLDEYFAGTAPVAVDFYDTELRKGYDPLDVYEKLFHQNAAPPDIVDEAGLRTAFSVAP